MRENHTQLVIVLDRSGSMGNIADATISAYNEFINGQKHIEGTANVMLAQFDDKYEVLYNQDLRDVPVLDRKSFIPRGSTALNDAIGKSITDVGNDLKNMSESERPSKVIVAIFTDGGENSSRQWTKEAVAELIKEQTNKYSWDFSFFGANQDAVLTGGGYNIHANNSFSFNSTAGSVKNTMSYYNKMSEYTRRGAMAPAAFTRSMKLAALNNNVISDDEINAWVVPDKKDK
jgi:uncharacterized protein YegL